MTYSRPPRASTSVQNLSSKIFEMTCDNDCAIFFYESISYQRLSEVGASFFCKCCGSGVFITYGHLTSDS